MTFRMVNTQHLPTLALVALGASESQVGLQNALTYGLILVQLLALRAVGHVSKRGILLASHGAALMAAAPLLFFDALSTLEPGVAVALALLCFAGVAASVNVSDTVWFPLLRSYVEPDRVGRFFGVLRSGWHLALIAYFAGSQVWLSSNPGRFAPLFAVAWALGVIRTPLIARLPERSERTGERFRAREVFALLRDERLRRYLATVAWGHGLRIAALPFAIVMMRRVSGFGEGEVLYTTVAFFAGGLVSLYPWGRVVDRVGAIAVLRFTSLGTGALIASLALSGGSGPGALALVVLWFFGVSVLASGFGVADTHLLFALTPPEAPARTIVLTSVMVGSAGGLAPLLGGMVLDALLPEGGGAAGLGVYRGFFAAIGALAMLGALPLRGARAA